MVIVNPDTFLIDLKRTLALGQSMEAIEGLVIQMQDIGERHVDNI